MREEYLITLRKSRKKYCSKRDIKERDIDLNFFDQKNKLEWLIRIVHEPVNARTPEEKESQVRLVRQRHPRLADNVTEEGKHLTQHKSTIKSIEQVCLQMIAREEQQHKNYTK